MLWAALATWAILGLFLAHRPVVGWVWLAAGIALMIGQFWFIRCARCRSHIPSVMGVGLGKHFNPINFCPFCGVGLDERADP